MAAKIIRTYSKTLNMGKGKQPYSRKFTEIGKDDFQGMLVSIEKTIFKDSIVFFVEDFRKKRIGIFETMQQAKKAAFDFADMFRLTV